MSFQNKTLQGQLRIDTKWGGVNCIVLVLNLVHIERGEGPWENWEKVQVLRIQRGVVVFPSRVIRGEYRILGAQNDHQMMPDISA